MSRAAIALLGLLACATPAAKPVAPVKSSGATDDDRLARMTAELHDDILGGYERDEPPEIESGMIAPAVGGARICSAVECRP